MGWTTGLDPDLAAAINDLVAALSQAGLSPQITSAYRSRANQARLYRKFLSGTSPYPVAPPGTSSHEYGWAVDIVTTPLDALADAGALWESWGGAWGGSRDPVHFELPGASQAARGAAGPSAPEAPKAGSTIATVADFILGLNPYIGAVELGATLASWGFGHSEIGDFLSGPFEYFQKRS